MNTSDFLNSLWSSIPEDVRNITLIGYASLIVVSIILALMVAYMYHQFFDPNTTGSRIHRSFPILAPAVTTIFITVQYSLPLSLGLLGALSIVRFRTPIKEPEEIGFILLVIACSLSIATFNVSFALVLYVVVYISLFIRSKWPAGFDLKRDNKHSLNVLFNNDSTDNDSTDHLDALSANLTSSKVSHRIISAQITDQGTSATLALDGRSGDDKQSIALMKSLKDAFPDAQFDYYRG